MQYSVNGTDWKDIPGVEPFKNTRHIQVDLSDKNIKAQYVRLENQENQESWIAFREFDVDARYVRLINKTDAKKTFDIQKLSLKTFEIYEKSLVADQTTFAIGEAASNPATNLFDGDRTTQVIYQGSQNQGAKFVYDLGQTIDLKTLKVVCRDSEIDFPHHAKISVSTDGQKWTDVMTIGNQDKENEGEASNEDNINDVLPLHETSYNAKLEENINQKARFIKFEITRTKVGSDKWVRFQEFKINGGEYMPTVNDPTFESDCLDTRNGKYAYMVDADLSTAFVPAKETGTLNYTVSDNNNVNVIKIIQGADAISNATVKARTLKNPDKWITLGTLAQTVNEFVLEKDTVLLDVKLEWKNVTPSITELVFAKTDTVNVDKAELKKLLDNKEDTSSWTTDSKQAYDAAIAAGQKVYDSEHASKGSVDSAVLAIKNAVADKELKGDMSKLQAALDKALKDSEPSLYEVTPLCAGVPADKAGDAAELESMIGLAEEADRTSDYYVNAPQELKDAFEESISDGKEMLKASQDLMDSRTEFLSNRYDRLGFGETDKSALETLIARAEEALKGEYTNESLYQLKKVLAEAKEVLADESAKQPTVDQTAQKLQKALDNLEQGGFEEIQVPSGELQGSDKWIHAGKFKATADDNAGPLTYEYTGHFIQVPTVKGDDHGVIRVTLQDQSGKQIYQEEIDTYAQNRVEGTELMQEEFAEDSYTIQFERVGKSTQAQDKRGWVEVGALTIRKEKKEMVDRCKLEEELKLCEGLNEKEYTTESWTALQEVVKSATELLKKLDEETCTSEMNDKAAEVEAARENLQKVTVDISELKEVIKTAKAISSEGYTKESFEALQQGIIEAEVLLNGTYTQDEVNEKTAILKQRISGLRADKTALQEKYDKIKDMTQGQATDESWKEFTGLREQAKNVLDNPNATPNEVSEILEKLNKFEFTYKDKESGEEDKKDPNPGTSGDSEQQGTSDTSHKKESVKTGDTTAIAVPVAGIVGVAVLLYVMRKRRKIES